VKIEVSLNEQQLELLDLTSGELELGSTHGDMVAEACRRLLADASASGSTGNRADAAGRSRERTWPADMSYGGLREEFVLEPVTGRALPVYRGEVIRITQIEGGQCVDFNGFNLHDYKERLDVGRTRLYHGLFPGEGACIYSNSPRDRVMYAILEMPDTCKAETLGARCNGTLFERVFGFKSHTNCQDTLAASIGEWGLTPDDVHDSFNMWMNTDVRTDGTLVLRENTGRPGDHVDLLAVIDTLSVPLVCGSGDVFITSNFWLKPIKVEILEASHDTLGAVESIESRYNRFENQRTPADFTVDQIRPFRSLSRSEQYEARFVRFPLSIEAVPVELEDDVLEGLRRLQDDGWLPGESDGALVRSAAMMHVLDRISRLRGDVEFVFPEPASTG
jgi:uncharacterized protein YcgI (DUF1989 family)